MHLITTQTATELDVLYSLYLMAIDFTVKIKPEKESELAKWLDTRQRILGKAAVVSDNVAKFLSQFKSEINVSASERALIEEKKNMVKDTLVNLRKKEFDLMRSLYHRLGNVRGELANLTRKGIASRAYANAPRSKLLVA